MDNKPFIDKNNFTKLFRELTLEEVKSFDLKAMIVSDAIRQEAKNVGEDIDKLIENGTVLENVVMEIASTVLSRWLSQPTDFPATDGSEDPYDPSVTWYNSTNNGVIILRRELKRLGILGQKIIVMGGESK